MTQAIVETTVGFIVTLTTAILITFNTLAVEPNPTAEFREYNTSINEDGGTCAQFGILPASVKPCGE